MHLQVTRHEGLARKALENQIQLRPLEPPRGAIYDRAGILLAGNNTLFSLEVSSDSAARVLGKIDSLTDAVPISADAADKLRAAAKSRVYKGVITLKEGLDENEISAFLSVQFLFPEVVLRAELAREYPRGELAAHVVGHVGRINESDKEKLVESGEWRRRYHGAKFIGRAGVELMNESTLRGALGAQEAHVDAHGRVLARRVLRPARPGRDLRLAMDARLQALAEKLLGGRRGAVAAMQVHTGEILALASSPRFDPNLFTFGISPNDWRRLNESEERPLVHRAIHGQYAPGSTVKPLLALAALPARMARRGLCIHVARILPIGRQSALSRLEEGRTRQDRHCEIHHSLGEFLLQSTRPRCGNGKSAAGAGGLWIGRAHRD